MLIGGATELDQASHAVRVADEEVKQSDNEVKIYERKVSHYKSKITQTERDISQKNDKLKQTREEIQTVKKQIERLADFQTKARNAVHLLSVLSAKARVIKSRRFILQEPVMKVMEDIMSVTNELTGNKLLYDKDMSRLFDQMKKNNQHLEDI